MSPVKVVFSDPNSRSIIRVTGLHREISPQQLSLSVSADIMINIAFLPVVFSSSLVEIYWHSWQFLKEGGKTFIMWINRRG